MTELYRHIGPNVDVPAGDIGVGAREIGYLYGQFKRIKNQFQPAVLTGKGLNYGGSLVRKEATGYGLIYFMKEMLDHHKIDLKDKTIAISGSGNVAIYACEKAQQFGGKVIAMSDSKGYIVDSNGINLDTIKQIKEVERKRISEYIEYHPNAEYHENQQDLWSVKCDIALPCAAQNDINLESAKKIVANGTLAVGEGANMPCTNDAINYFLENNVLLAPAKAANAGGVATSALEMSQNSMRLSWSFEEVNRRLNEIMVNIFSISKEAAIEYNMEGNYVAGANIAGFLRVAHAISDQGII
jgi:glutamate dehydrogenase (NADP+)